MRVGSVFLRWSASSFLVLGCSGGGSESDPVASDCDAGTEGCVCDEGSSCGGGLVCLSAVCVDDLEGPTPSGGNAGDGDGDSGGTSPTGGGTSGGRDAGSSGGRDAGGMGGGGGGSDSGGMDAGGSGSGGTDASGSGGTDASGGAPSGGGAGGTQGGGTGGSDGLPDRTIFLAGADPGFEYLSAGWGISCGVVTGGSVYCWGANSGQGLGIEGDAEIARPEPVPGITDAVLVEVGALSICALQEGGTVSCWGENSNGQLGNGTKTVTTSPTPVTGLENVATVSVNLTHGCAVHTDGTASCWGRNNEGFLGDPSFTEPESLVPRQVPGLSDLVDIQVYAYTTCAEHADGRVSCWGWNHRLHIPTLSFEDWTATPTLMEELYPTRYYPYPTLNRALGMGTTFVCAHVEAPSGIFTGDLLCWGDEINGELPSAPIVPDSPYYDVVSTNVLVFGVGHQHACVRFTTGAYSCWGRNSDGQLGAGHANDSVHFASPDFPDGAAPVVQFALGETHSCALHADKRATCWGDNSDRALGIVSSLDRYDPTSVGLIIQ